MAIVFKIKIVVILLPFLISPDVWAQTLSSSNLPIVVIETEGNASVPYEPKGLAHMGIIFNEGGRNNTTDAFNNYNGKIGIENRGSSSLMFPKVQYGIELWNNELSDTSVSLLNLPSEEDWVLFAPYNDKSLMRDVLAYKMGRDLGRYAPRTVFCELILNNDYKGIYVLIEKIKRDANRVNISKLAATELGGEDLTGGYILKIDKFSGNGSAGFNSKIRPYSGTIDQKIYFHIDYPEPGSLQTQQAAYIQKFIDDFESTLYSKSFTDPDQGYQAYIDVDSFIDFMIINEVSKNVDGYRLSTYLHKDKNSKGGKLHMGPIWDFNLGFGNANYCTSGNPEGFVYVFNSICPEDFWLVPFWWSRLHNDTNFKKRLGERWIELRNGAFQTEKLHAYIDSVATVLDESQKRNFQRWPVLGVNLWPNFYVGQTFQAEVDFLKTWVAARMEWLDGKWENYVTEAEGDLPGGNFSVFPNPGGSEWKVEYSVTKPETVSFEIVDSQGRVIHEVQRFNAGASMKETLDIRKVPPGVYMIRMKLNGVTTATRRAVKD
jgi:hypothetical protein